MLLSLVALAISPDASALLKRVTSTYQSYTSYQDTVQVITKGTTEWRQSFKTLFKRPGHWRFDYFEYQTNGTVNQCVLWKSGKNTFFWADADGGKPTVAPTVGLAFGSMSMIAGDFVKIVPNLLDPKSVDSSAISRLTKLTLLPEAMLGKANCYRIVGTEPPYSKLTLWIDKNKLLIRQIVRDTTHPDVGKVSIQATFAADPNLKIAPSAFKFVPPK